MLVPRLGEDAVQCARRVLEGKSADLKERSVCRGGNAGVIDLGAKRDTNTRLFLFFGLGNGEVEDDKQQRSKRDTV